MIQINEAGRHARLDGLYNYIGAAPTLEIRTLTKPINCAASDVGVLLWTLVLPFSWMAAASGGKREKLGAWTANGVATGTASHYRIKVSGVCVLQGDVGFGFGHLQLTGGADITNGVSKSVSVYAWEEGSI